MVISCSTPAHQQATPAVNFHYISPVIIPTKNFDLLLKKIDEVNSRVEEVDSKVDELRKEMSDGLRKVNDRLDKIGTSLAYLEDDAPTRDEFDSLENRVEKLENSTTAN